MAVARRRRRIAVVAWLLAGILAISGCAATGARGDFEREFRGDPAIADLEVTTGDNMPFTDGVRATIVASDDPDSQALAGLIARLSAFIREHPDEPVLLTVQSGPVIVPVFGTDAVNTAALEVATTIASEEYVDSVEFTATSDREEITGVSINLSADVASALDMVRSSAERVEAIGASGGVRVTVRDAGTAVRISGVPGPWLDDAEASFARASTVATVTGMRADDTRITLTLSEEADVAAAQAAVHAAGASLETPITFASPLVLLGQGGDGDEVRVILDALDEQSRQLVHYVWTDATRAEFFVDSSAAATALEAAFDALPKEARGELAVTVSIEGE